MQESSFHGDYWILSPGTKQLIRTRMHSSGMRTVRSSSRLSLGGICLSACWDTTPRLGTPRPGTPQDQAPLHGPGTPLDQAPPRSRPPGPGTPLEADTPRDQAPSRSRPPCGQTDTCKNITFATSLGTVKMQCLNNQNYNVIDVSQYITIEYQQQEILVLLIFQFGYFFIYLRFSFNFIRYMSCCTDLRHQGHLHIRVFHKRISLNSANSVMSKIITSFCGHFTYIEAL